MKKNKLSIKELKDGQLAYIEFNLYDITQCETDEEYDEKIEEIITEYQDGIFKVDLIKQKFVRIGSEDDSIYFYHNLIGDIYEV